MDELTLNDFLSGFDDPGYPDAFLQKYELMECLASNQMGETLLVRDRLNAHYVAKCYNDPSLMSRTTEDALLKKLHHDGLPAFVEEFQNENMLCVVRQYVHGEPLNRLQIPLTEYQIISIGMQLCDILSYLHSQIPAVIHRDIKPQNIILDSGGKVTLIDFGISRLYDPNADNDTVFFGTQEYAPPEQYGFAQTDSRADIFALGAVLATLLTGKTNDDSAIDNRRLRRIIQRCMAFAPKDRYRDAKSVKRALANVDGHRQKRAIYMGCAAVALCLAVAAGFVIGRYTDVRPVLFYDNSVTVFDEPLIEQAVRLQLGKTADEPILSEELDRVTEIHVYYDQAANTWEEFNTLREGLDTGEIMAGSDVLSTLDDIVKLKNLKELSIGYANITDISAVKNLTRLQSLEFFGCPIEDISAVGSLAQLEHFVLDNCDDVRDISALADCSRLSELVLAGCRADDFSVLASLGDLEYLHLQNVDPELFLPHLKGKTVRQLKLGYTSLSSISDLFGIDGLNDLQLYKMNIKTLDGIDQMEDLMYVTLREMPLLNLEPLSTLPYLQTLTLSEDMRDAATAIGETRFQVLYQ